MAADVQSLTKIMPRYDPEQAPDATEWLELDEQEQIDMVEQYHRAARIKLPNLQMHAIIHQVVENQVAEGHEPVVRAMSRLVASGLSRHDAIHAIGSVLAEHIFELLQDTSGTSRSMADYDAAVERLTAESWRHG